LLISCTHKPYHPEKIDREWAIDNSACEKSVREDVRYNPDTYDIYDEMRMIRECMQDKGWRWKSIGLLGY